VYLERFLMEEWIARRINSPYVLKPCPQTRQRNFLYVATEYVEGQTLAQWMIDHPKPSVELVRSIIDQVGKGLRAFHRLEMLHQDLKPDNVLIDRTGTVKIIDFGSTRVAGIQEKTRLNAPGPMLGAEQYSAPEYFLGHDGSPRADLFSLGVIMYQMLSGGLPYGAQVPKAKTLREQRKLHYRSLLIDRPEIPAWIDETLRKALSPEPGKRYADLSEFTFDLHHPNKAFLNQVRTPLIERNPAVFWQVTSFVLALVVLILLNNVVNTVR
jgi:serine/threonine protein kinase